MGPDPGRLIPSREIPTETERLRRRRRWDTVLWLLIIALATSAIAGLIYTT